MQGNDTDIAGAIEQQLAERLPQVDLLEAAVVGRDGGTLRAVIDHPAGVDHELCAAVTGVLEEAGYRDRYGIEVSSPGPEPPLRTEEHFRRAVGRRVRLRLQDEERASRSRECTGTLVDAGAGVLTVALADGVTEIPLAQVRRARALAGPAA